MRRNLGERGYVQRYLRTWMRRSGLDTDVEAARVLRLRGAQVSATHMQRLARGTVHMPARLCNIMARVLMLTMEERHRLARAAAKDAGYDIGNIDAGPEASETE